MSFHIKCLESSKLSMAPPKSAILRLHCCTRIFIEYGQQHQKIPLFMYIFMYQYRFLNFLDFWTKPTHHFGAILLNTTSYNNFFKMRNLYGWLFFIIVFVLKQIGL